MDGRIGFFNQIHIYMKQPLHLIIFISISIITSSCIPNKKVVYLQSDMELKQNLPTDSLSLQFSTSNYEYKLQAGDVVSVKVSSLTNPQYSFFANTEKELNSNMPDPQVNGYTINEAGDIILPAVGEVKLEGMTLEQAQGYVQTQIEHILESPTVNIKLLNFHFSILGEVNRPGKYTSYNTRLNILEGIAMANDLTPFANRKNLKLVRFGKNQANVYYLNVLDDDLLSSPYFYLKPNDIVVVAPLKSKNVRQNQLPVASFVLSTLTAMSFLIWRLTN